ncbi:MAG: triose-phosphate isomerase [bacterium]|nr:triose-phosphate isomerase [bacterium]
MKYVFGNWKMELGVRESIALTRGILRSIRGAEHLPELVIFPSFTALSEIRKLLTRSRMKFGAQNMAAEVSGAYTGEVSSGMLEELRTEYVLIGHSERRQLFGETNELVRAKLERAMKSSMQPVLCIGEPKEVRTKGGEHAYISKQIQVALQNLRIPSKKRVIIAYEPVWAIGTGAPASLEQILDMHTHIRREVAKEVSAAKTVHILYGGSVNGDNAYQLLRERDIDGVLVGGASVKLNEFCAILTRAKEVVEMQS